MQQRFQKIGLVGRYRSEHVIDTVQLVINYLKQRQLDVVLEKDTASVFDNHNLLTYPVYELGQHCDLIIVIGGDGSLLNAAKTAVKHDVPILGVNRGRLGFLTDIKPDNLEQEIAAVLDGHYKEEQRFLLSATLTHAGEITHQEDALNDVVLLPGDIPHMIEFEIHIDDDFMYCQWADGIIVTTPTGSTAYALSGGGPILHPSLNAIALVPMFPHTLSSRPIVVDSHREIRIVITTKNNTTPKVSCDGHARKTIQPSGEILIKRKPESLRLIHPKAYNYFENLRSKLGWERDNHNI